MTCGNGNVPPSPGALEEAAPHSLLHRPNGSTPTTCSITQEPTAETNQLSSPQPLDSGQPSPSALGEAELHSHLHHRNVPTPATSSINQGPEAETNQLSSPYPINSDPFHLSHPDLAHLCGTPHESSERESCTILEPFIELPTRVAPSNLNQLVSTIPLYQPSGHDWSTQEPKHESSVAPQFPTPNLHCPSPALNAPLADDPLTDHSLSHNQSASPTVSVHSTSSGQGAVSPGLETPPGKRRRRDSLLSTPSPPGPGWTDPCLRSPSPDYVRWAEEDEGWEDSGLETPPGKSKPWKSSYVAETDEQSSGSTDTKKSGQASPRGKQKIKAPADSAWVKARLKAYGLHQEDAAIHKYPDFVNQVKEILQKKRDSEVSAKEQRSFTVAHGKFQDFNKDTLLYQLMPFLVKRERTVPQNLVDRADIAQSEEAQVSVTFVNSGLMTIRNREFSHSLPWFLDEDKDLNKAMMKDAHTTNPKPDLTFAVNVNKLPWPENNFVIPAKLAALMDVVRSCCHPFSFWEAKSDKGSLADARNQACRCGAKLQYYERYLRAIVGEKDVPGPDTRTFVFSIVSSPEVIEIYVHWVEVDSDKSKEPIYHMNRLTTKALADDEGLGPIRRPIHNILDWGIGGRFDALAGLHQAIIDHATKVAIAKQEAAAAKVKQSPKKKQKFT